jgi:hypothetical protein
MKRNIFFNTTPRSFGLAIPGTSSYGINLNDPYYNNPGFLGLLLHEATHVTFDQTNEKYLKKKEWQDAIAKDKFFISYYGKDNPYTEDLAVTLDAYLIYRYKPEKLSKDFRDFLRRTMYSRFIILDNFDFYSKNN